MMKRMKKEINFTRAQSPSAPIGVASLTLFIINASMKFIFDNCRVSEATLMGAEGDCALVKLILETVPQTIHKLI